MIKKHWWNILRKRSFNNMFTIKVPASSANIGPGFDSLGIALKRYLSLTVVPSKEWKFNHVNTMIPTVRHYKDHYIYKVATKIATWYQRELPPCHVTMKNEIPLARGVGSNAVAVGAAIEMVNQLCELQFSDDEIVGHAVRIEVHPDNLAPALFGVLLVAVHMNDQTSYQQIPNIDTDVVIYI